MSASDISKTIQDALANGLNQNKPNGDDLTMSMTNPYNNNNQAGTSLMKTPLTFNVYDQATGRNWTEDSNGRRITPRRDMTGSQLVAIQSMRTQIGLPTLNNHNVSQMSIDSASRMQDDLRWMIEQFRIIADAKARMEAEHAHQVAVLMDELDKAIKDPKIGAEIALRKQAESMRNNQQK